MSQEAVLVALRRVLSDAGFPTVFGRDDVRYQTEAGTVFAKPSVGETLVWVEDAGGTQLARVAAFNPQQAVGAWSLALDLLETREEYLG